MFHIGNSILLDISCSITIMIVFFDLIQCMLDDFEENVSTYSNMITNLENGNTTSSLKNYENINYFTEDEKNLETKNENENAQETIGTVEKSAIKIDVSDMKKLLSNELIDLSPEIHSKILSSIESNKIDRNKYKDLLLIKKRSFTKGNKKIVKFDIKERIIPKDVNNFLEGDLSIKIMLATIMLLLLGLVLTVSMRTYEYIFKNNILGLEKKIIK